MYVMCVDFYNATVSHYITDRLDSVSMPFDPSSLSLSLSLENPENSETSRIGQNRSTQILTARTRIAKPRAAWCTHNSNELNLRMIVGTLIISQNPLPLSSPSNSIVITQTSIFTRIRRPAATHNPLSGWVRRRLCMCVNVRLAPSFIHPGCLTQPPERQVRGVCVRKRHSISLFFFLSRVIWTIWWFFFEFVTSAVDKSIHLS